MMTQSQMMQSSSADYLDLLDQNQLSSFWTHTHTHARA